MRPSRPIQRCEDGLSATGAGKGAVAINSYDNEIAKINSARMHRTGASE